MWFSYCCWELLEAKIDIEKNKSKYQNQNVDSIIDQADTESIIIDDSSSFSHLESLFSRALGGTHPILDVKLWHLYVNHVRKKNQSKAWEENSLDEEVLLARQSIMKAFELALQSVGYYDVGSIIIWNDFLEFVKGIPVNILSCYSILFHPSCLILHYFTFFICLPFRHHQPMSNSNKWNKLEKSIID